MLILSSINSKKVTSSNEPLVIPIAVIICSSVSVSIAPLPLSSLENILSHFDSSCASDKFWRFSGISWKSWAKFFIVTPSWCWPLRMISFFTNGIISRHSVGESFSSSPGFKSNDTSILLTDTLNLSTKYCIVNANTSIGNSTSYCALDLIPKCISSASFVLNRS